MVYENEEIDSFSFGNQDDIDKKDLSSKFTIPLLMTQAESFNYLI